MAVRIGHASIGSDGKIKNDVYGIGDNNGKEVCIRTYYKKNWQYVIRFKDRKLAENAVKNCIILCQNDYVGYDQNRRNSLRAELAKVNWVCSQLNTRCSTDCSAFMSVICESIGISIPYNSGNAPTTSTMVNAFKLTGFFDILTDSKYLNSDEYLMMGDILVKAGSHTVMVLENGSKSKSSGTSVVKQTETKVDCLFKVGQTYTLQSNLFVRCIAQGEKKLLSQLSANAKKNAYDDGNGYGILRKGTRVTCQEIKIIGKQTWIKIPSGWLCAVDNSKIYIA